MTKNQTWKLSALIFWGLMFTEDLISNRSVHMKVFDGIWFGISLVLFGNSGIKEKKHEIL